MNRITTIYNAIPDDCFDVVPDRQGVRSEFGIPEAGRVAVYAGRLAAYKGCDTLLDALGPILHQENLYLLYVGAPDPTVEGSEDMIQQMQHKISSEGWQDRVRFLGHRKDVPRLLAASDVLTHPTRIEGFGLTLVEAMAAGIPVVASNVEGIPEVLEGTASAMVPPDDPRAFREAVLKTLGRTEAAAAQAEAQGRARAEDFRIQKRVLAMRRLFTSLVEERR